MERIKAFGAALVLFLATVLCCHYYAETHLQAESSAYALWPSEKKSVSAEGLRRNMEEKVIPVFGSSELQHGSDTPFHPVSIFSDTDTYPMLIGAGYYQSLGHAITLAAISDTVQTKKAVLILSPQWFRKTGVVDQAFTSRFSEIQYAGMLENEQLSDEVKTYISERTQSLLGDLDPKTLEHVRRHEAVLWKKTAGSGESLYESSWLFFLQERDRFTTAGTLLVNGFLKKQERSGEEPDWEGLRKAAEEAGERENTNPFYIEDEVYEKLKPYLPEKKDMNADAEKGYQTGPEFKDLACFLQVCRELSIEPMLVIMPVNGYYYDHTGFPKSAREAYYEKVRKIAADYDAEIADFSGDEYTPYFFEDRVHLGKKGWVEVCERIWKFAG